MAGYELEFVDVRVIRVDHNDLTQSAWNRTAWDNQSEIALRLKKLITNLIVAMNDR